MHIDQNSIYNPNIEWCTIR